MSPKGLRCVGISWAPGKPGSLVVVIVDKIPRRPRHFSLHLCYLLKNPAFIAEGRILPQQHG
jgi:hypothetical protein